MTGQNWPVWDSQAVMFFYEGQHGCNCWWHFPPQSSGAESAPTQDSGQPIHLSINQKNEPRLSSQAIQQWSLTCVD